MCSLQSGLCPFQGANPPHSADVPRGQSESYCAECDTPSRAQHSYSAQTRFLHPPFCFSLRIGARLPLGLLAVNQMNWSNGGCLFSQCRVCAMRRARPACHCLPLRHDPPNMYTTTSRRRRPHGHEVPHFWCAPELVHLVRSRKRS